MLPKTYLILSVQMAKNTKIAMSLGYGEEAKCMVQSIMTLKHFIA